MARYDVSLSMLGLQWSYAAGKSSTQWPSFLIYREESISDYSYFSRLTDQKKVFCGIISHLMAIVKYS
jgi:hypothetical protein